MIYLSLDFFGCRKRLKRCAVANPDFFIFDLKNKIGSFMNNLKIKMY